ncbi:hypothetical protein ACFO0N_02975 [Halobium salinum]|uniref:Uncharacterized protein n=1 Tax=Halobium salinum TaxID=1364940 RepID=A0ABD5P8D1_9EURY|nr:hypothetical protein [Halobium salinum]
MRPTTSRTNVARAGAVGVRTLGAAVGLGRRTLLLLRVVAFWTAVSLPALYPLLLLGLLPAGVLTVIELLAVHTLTLVLGRGYGRTPTSG